MVSWVRDYVLLKLEKGTVTEPSVVLEASSNGRGRFDHGSYSTSLDNVTREYPPLYDALRLLKKRIRTAAIPQIKSAAACQPQGPRIPEFHVRPHGTQAQLLPREMSTRYHGLHRGTSGKLHSKRRMGHSRLLVRLTRWVEVVLELYADQLPGRCDFGTWMGSHGVR